MATSKEARNRAQARYNKANTTQMIVKFNHRTETDILEHLRKQPNKQGFIKRLIREDMEKSGAV